MNLQLINIFILIYQCNSEKLKTSSKIEMKNVEPSSKTYIPVIVLEETDKSTKGIKLSPILFPNSNKTETVIIPYAK